MALIGVVDSEKVLKNVLPVVCSFGVINWNVVVQLPMKLASMQASARATVNCDVIVQMIGIGMF
jgi:hypothetical protein